MTKSTDPFEHVDLYLKMDKFQFRNEEEEDPQEKDQEGGVQRIPEEEIEDTDPLEKGSEHLDDRESEQPDPGMFAIEKALAKEGMSMEEVDPSVLDAMKNLADDMGTSEAGDEELNPETAKDLFARFIEAVGGDIEQAVELMQEYLAEFGPEAAATAMKNGEEAELPADDKVPGSEKTSTTGFPPSPDEPSGESGGQGESPPGSKEIQKAGQVKLPTGDPGESEAGKKKSTSAGAEETEEEE